MPLDQEIAALSRMTTKQLKRRFAELTGDATSANNRPWLIKRLAWKFQALAHGGLSERAFARAEELANDADLRLLPPREATAHNPTTTSTVPTAASKGSRLPPGRDIRVTVLSTEFEGTGSPTPPCPPRPRR